MNIGQKIKQARVTAGLTQERAAESLGVSRQTVSNWENEKTYPDIVSVVKMSDLYGISLDLLLKGKEAQTVSDYLGYLEESTNVVKSKRKLSAAVLVGVYTAIWAASLIVFWLFTDGSDAMGYSLMFLWILLPVTMFASAWQIGRENYWGKWKWLATVAFGLTYMLAEYGTFSMANMIAFNKFNVPSVTMVPVGAAISAAGLAAGTCIRAAKIKKNHHE